MHGGVAPGGKPLCLLLIITVGQLLTVQRDKRSFSFAPLGFNTRGHAGRKFFFLPIFALFFALHCYCSTSFFHFIFLARKHRGTCSVLILTVYIISSDRRIFSLYFF